MRKLKIQASTKEMFLFVAPALVYMLVFVGWPLLQNIVLSLKNVDVYTFADKANQKFIGLQNFKELFTGSSIMAKSIKNTLLFTIGSIFFQFIIGFALALLYNHDFPGCNFFRGVSMISWILPVTVVGLLFKFIFSEKGLANQLLLQIGIIDKPIEWLLQSKEALVSIVIANIWIGIPFNMILILTGLTTVPAEIYESAKIDGAGKVRTLLQITVPMIKPAIMSVLTLGFVYTFKVFDLVWIMTKGGPVQSTELVSTYTYRLSFEQFLFSKGAASASILFLIMLVVGLFYIKSIDASEEM